MDFQVKFEAQNEMDVVFDSGADEFCMNVGSVMRGPPGVNGISPDVKVVRILGGHRMTIEDADGVESFDVLDGTDASVEAMTNMEIEEMLK